jgi:hypothetical protein
MMEIGDASESTPHNGRGPPPLQSSFNSVLDQITSGQRQAFVASMPSTHHAGILPEQFDGQGFKIWAQKMTFYLSTLNLAKYLKEEKPVLSLDQINACSQAVLDNWDQGDYMCRG